MKKRSDLDIDYCVCLHKNECYQPFSHATSALLSALCVGGRAQASPPHTQSTEPTGVKKVWNKYIEMDLVS